MDQLAARTQEIWQTSLTYLSSPQFYLQIVFVGVALALAWTLTVFLLSHVALLRDAPRPGPA